MKAIVGGAGWPGGFQCSMTELRVLILDGYVFFHSLSSHISWNEGRRQCL